MFYQNIFHKICILNICLIGDETENITMQMNMKYKQYSCFDLLSIICCYILFLNNYFYSKPFLFKVLRPAIGANDSGATMGTVMPWRISAATSTNVWSWRGAVVV